MPHRYLTSIWFGNLLLQEVFDKWLRNRISDTIKKQMKTFSLAVKYEFRDQYFGFIEKETLDKFPSEFFHGNDQYDFLCKVCKIDLTLSRQTHGQVTVERGFRVNKG